jgi:hypothetical protein
MACSANNSPDKTVHIVTARLDKQRRGEQGSVATITARLPVVPPTASGIVPRTRPERLANLIALGFWILDPLGTPYIMSPFYLERQPHRKTLAISESADEKRSIYIFRPRHTLNLTKPLGRCWTVNPYTDSQRTCAAA